MQQANVTHSFPSIMDRRYLNLYFSERKSSTAQKISDSRKHEVFYLTVSKLFHLRYLFNLNSTAKYNCTETPAVRFLPPRP